MASTVESFTAGTETAVDVAQVERQLRDLWKLASKDSRQRITRACLFNLVAYTETDADRDRVTGIISEVTSRHPCRAMVLLAKPGEPDEIGASITAHCHLAGGGKQVCCEQISIHASGKNVADLPEGSAERVLWTHIQYIEKYRGHMDYPEYRKRGWPIGSGHVEAACKRIGNRMKGANKRWTPEGAESIAAVICDRASEDGRWASRWPEQILAA